MNYTIAAFSGCFTNTTVYLIKRQSIVCIYDDGDKLWTKKRAEKQPDQEGQTNVTTSILCLFQKSY